MKIFLKIISLIGLLLTMIPPVLIFMGEIELEETKWLMALGMFAWFGSAPFWINKKSEKSDVG